MKKLFIAFFFLLSCGDSDSSLAIHQAEAEIPVTSFVEARNGIKTRILQHAPHHIAAFKEHLAELDTQKKKAKTYLELQEPGGVGPYNRALYEMYYDRAHALYQAATLFDLENFVADADAAAIFFRDHYVMHPEQPKEKWGRVPGYWNFSTGLAEHYQRSKSAPSKEAVLLLAKRAMYAAPAPGVYPDSNSPERSREVAYGILAQLSARRVTENRDFDPVYLERLTDFALGHVDQWLGKSPWIGIVSKKPYVAPFMVALTAYALTEVNEIKPNEGIVTRLRNLGDYLLDHLYIPEEKTFRYTDREKAADESFPQEALNTESAPDLNLMVFPLYAWLYHRTNEEKYQDISLKILAKGINGAYWSGGKQFNQQFFWLNKGLSYLQKKDSSKITVHKPLLTK
jgi:hypothetical protein